eukprot:jgi/Galph1/5166/GphlegSOOS_G3894.1
MQSEGKNISMMAKEPKDAYQQVEEEKYFCTCVYNLDTVTVSVIRNIKPILASVFCVEDWDIVKEETMESYPWTFENHEVCLFVAGKFQVSLEGSKEPVVFTKGDLVRFPKGAHGQVTILEPCKRRYLVCSEEEWKIREQCAMDALKSMKEEEELMGFVRSNRMRERFQQKETFPTWFGFVLGDFIQFGAAFVIYYFWDSGPGSFIKNSTATFIIRQLIIPLGMIGVFLSFLSHLYIGIEPYIPNEAVKKGVREVFYFLAPSNILLDKMKQQILEETQPLDSLDELQ